MIYVYTAVLLAGAVLTVIAARRRSGALTPAMIGTILGAGAIITGFSIGPIVAVAGALVLVFAAARLGRRTSAAPA